MTVVVAKMDAMAAGLLEPHGNHGNTEPTIGSARAARRLGERIDLNHRVKLTELGPQGRGTQLRVVRSGADVGLVGRQPFGLTTVARETTVSAMTTTIKPRRGMRFEHTRFIDPRYDNRRVPDVCEVTAVRRYAVHYRTCSGMRMKVAAEKFPTVVGRIVQP